MNKSNVRKGTTMDPVSAVGLSGNVIQLVDFVCKLIQESRDIYTSASGLVGKGNSVLKEIAVDINRLTNQIRISPDHSGELRSLASKAQAVSQEILVTLQKLTVDGEKTRWKSFRAALKAVWTQDKLDEMSASLRDIQSQINMHLHTLLRCVIPVQITCLCAYIDHCDSAEVSQISRSLGSLELSDAQLNLKMDQQILSLRQSEAGITAVNKQLNDRLKQGVYATTADNTNVVENDDGESNREHELLATVCKELKELREAIPAMEKHQEFLLSLWFDSITTRRDNIPVAHKSTFSWIFKNTLPDTSQSVYFSTWLANEGGTFWIKGKAGSGKSTLMKFLGGNAETYQLLNIWAGVQPLVVAHYYFWNSGTALQKSQTGLLRSLLFEILRQCPDLVSPAMSAQSEFCAEPGKHSNFGKKWPSWDREMLLHVYQTLVQHNPSTKFCFFIDGLDEYKTEGDRDHDDLIRTLGLLSSTSQIKFCVSSRPWIVFEDAFGGNNASPVLKLEDLTRRDIHRYVSDTISEHKQFRKLVQSNPEYSALVQEVVDKAQGVFLWVYLVVRELLEGLLYNDTLHTMRRRLNHFPADLEAYFRHMINSIPKIYLKETAQTFRIALSRDEPFFMMTYSYLDDVDDQSNHPTHRVLKAALMYPNIARRYDTIRRRLDGRCKGLVEIVEQRAVDEEALARYTVDFLHRTVRDYLTRDEDMQDFIRKETSSGGKLWIKACFAAYRTLATRFWAPSQSELGIPFQSKLGIQNGWNEIFHFAFLANEASQDPTTADEILEMTEEIKVGMDREANLGLACEYGLTHYVRHEISE